MPQRGYAARLGLRPTGGGELPGGELGTPGLVVRQDHSELGLRCRPAQDDDGRLVDAAVHSLATPPSASLATASRLWVSLMAACSRSAMPALAAPGQSAPAEAAVPAHRQLAAPARGVG